MDAETDELVLVEGWASGCGPCLAKFPELRELYASYPDAEFQVFTVRSMKLMKSGNRIPKSRNYHGSI